MSETHLRQPRFTYRACGPFTKTKKGYKNLKKQKIHGVFIMAYRDFKYSNRGTDSDKTLHDKALNIAKNPKYDQYQRGLASMVYKFFDKENSWWSN